MLNSLKNYIVEAEKNHTAIGHFNISELGALKAVAEVARELDVPVIIGTSEGEREFLDVHEVVALVRSIREEFNQPIFLNADHTHSLEKIKEAVLAGYDAVLFDGGALPIEENIQKTKEVVEYVRATNPSILIEGELGNIGSGSEIRKELPAGAAIDPKDLTTAEDALRFVQETGVDLLAPAVGNIHGMFANAPEPALDINRISAIKVATKVPLVLHGGSGNTEDDFSKAISAGINIVHISTEIRAAWRKGIEEGLSEKPGEVAPYKLLEPAIAEMKKIVYNRLKLFNRLES